MLLHQAALYNENLAARGESLRGPAHGQRFVPVGMGGSSSSRFRITRRRMAVQYGGSQALTSSGRLSHSCNAVHRYWALTIQGGAQMWIGVALAISGLVIPSCFVVLLALVVRRLKLCEDHDT